MRLDELVAFLNANEGAVIALVSSASVIVTLLVVLEARRTRNLRLEAVVDARAKARTPYYLELDVRNYGPAIARDVVMSFEFRDGPRVVGQPRRQGETLLSPNAGRRFLPSPSQALLSLNDLAAQGLVLRVAWSWTDDRRRFGFFPLRHERSRSWQTTQLQRDFFGGWALTEYDVGEDLHEVADRLRKIESHVKAVGEVTKSDLRRAARAVSARAIHPVRERRTQTLARSVMDAGRGFLARLGRRV